MGRRQFTITIEENIIREYRNYCRDNDINMSKRIERYMKKDIKKGD